MELFSEIYGCYFAVISRILDQAQNGMTKNEIENLVSDYGFYDSAFYLLPSLFPDARGGIADWNLLNKRDNVYYSRLTRKTKRPLTILEKSWLKALTNDPRINLFLDEAQVTQLRESIASIEPLFLNDDFNVYDHHLDGDDYGDPEYISRFKTILKAIKEQQPLIIEYNNSKGGRTKRQYHPYKICYSARDDKFRLQCAAFNSRQNQLQRIFLNLARITAVQATEKKFDIRDKLQILFKETACNEPVVMEISKERNAIERCMLQFASFERQTEHDRERDIYIYISVGFGLIPVTKRSY